MDLHRIVDNHEEYLDYTDQKGTIEVLLEVGNGTTTFQQIEDTVLISQSTINKRLNRGIELDLIEVVFRRTDYGTQKRYTLTELGDVMLNYIEAVDLDTKTRRVQKAHREFDDSFSSLVHLLEGLSGKYDSKNDLPQKRIEKMKESTDESYEEEHQLDEEGEQSDQNKGEGSDDQDDSTN